MGGANSAGEREDPLEQLAVFYCFVKKRVNQALANKVFANTRRVRHNKTFE